MKGPINGPKKLGNKWIFALRKTTIRIDGESFETLEKVLVESRLVHHKAIHYAATTRCGYRITKRLRTAGNWKLVTCPECLQLHVSKLSDELNYYEGVLMDARGTESDKGRSKSKRDERSVRASC